MGGSTDAFKLYLDLFKVKAEPAAAESSTFWKNADGTEPKTTLGLSKEEVRKAMAGNFKGEGRTLGGSDKADSGYASEEAK